MDSQENYCILVNQSNQDLKLMNSKGKVVNFPAYGAVDLEILPRDDGSLPVLFVMTDNSKLYSEPELAIQRGTER
jgi:hypothetical protein